eukprot:COSAG06_NODE_6411_length_2944_cov_14.298770_1_plen_78_part_00
MHLSQNHIPGSSARSDGGRAPPADEQEVDGLVNPILHEYRDAKKKEWATKTPHVEALIGVCYLTRRCTGRDVLKRIR